MRILTLLGLIAVSIAWGSIQAAEFRQSKRIAVPTSPPEVRGSNGSSAFAPVSHEAARAAMGRVVDAWNARKLGPHLADNFIDGFRLETNLRTLVNDDARLKLQSIQSVQTLEQSVLPPASAGGPERLVSEVAITARTQLEFNDPGLGFRRIVGVNEFVLRMTQALER